MNSSRLQCLPFCWFFNPIKSKVVTMEAMKKGVTTGGKIHCDMERLNCRRLVVSQHRDVSLQVPFAMNRHHFHLQYFMIMAKRGNKVLLHKLAVWYDGPHKMEVCIVSGMRLYTRLVGQHPAHSMIFFRISWRLWPKHICWLWCLTDTSKDRSKHGSVLEGQKVHTALIII